MSALAIALIIFGDRFAWERRLEDMPALELAAALMIAGLVYGLLFPVIRGTLGAGASARRKAALWVLLLGLGLRLAMLPSVPALEDDYYRYLWDGAVTAAGYNPFAYAPEEALANRVPPPLQKLADDGILVLERVNHPELKTIYPPVAQAAFALAHWIEPWSLRAWRLVCLIGDGASAALILLLLSALGRSPLWVALYWLNPLVVKELFNSAHMEAIVLPFVLAALLLLVHRRAVLASAALGLAIGAKLWPVLLLPFVLRPLLGAPLRLLIALLVLAAMAIAWSLPPWLGGLGSDSGFVAYATHWQTNAALFQLLQGGAGHLAHALDWNAIPAGLVVRLAIGAGLVVLAVCLARDDRAAPDAIVARVAIVVLALFLLSPAQFPWYASWVLVFAPLLPLATHVGMTVFLPLYYASFHLLAMKQYAALNPWLMALEWLPIWALLMWDARTAWQRPLTADLTTNNPGRA